MTENACQVVIWARIRKEKTCKNLNANDTVLINTLHMLLTQLLCILTT